MIGITLSAISPRDKPLPLEELAPWSGRSEENVSRTLVDYDKTVRSLRADIPPEVLLASTLFYFSFPLVGW